MGLSNVNSQAKSDTCNLVLIGRVLDDRKEEGVAGALVHTGDYLKTTGTDAQGRFSLCCLCDSIYEIHVHSIGFKDYYFMVNPAKNQEIVLLLKEEVTRLDPVVVEGERLSEIQTLVENQMSRERLDEVSGKSLGETLKEISGVTSIQTGPTISKPIIHGLHSNRVLILNNGVRQEGQQWGLEHAPEIDPFVAGKITVVKGAASVRYGSDAIAGVVLVEPKELAYERALGGSINLVGASNGRQGIASGMIEGGMGRIALRLQGTINRAGNFNTPDYFLNNTGFKERNYSVAIGYRSKGTELEFFYSQFNNEIGILSGAHIGNITDLRNAIQLGKPAGKDSFTYEIRAPRQEIYHSLLRLKAGFRLNQFGKVELILGRQANHREEFDKHRGSNNPNGKIPALDFTLLTHTGDLIFTHKPVGRFTGSMGVQTMYQENVWEGSFLIPNFIQQSIGTFFIEQWTRRKLMLEAGIRFDARNLQTFVRERDNSISTTFSQWQSPSGNLGIRYAFNSNWSFNLNTGLAWRAPNVNELYAFGVHHGAAAFERGNKDLKAETGLKTILTTNYTNRLLTGELTLYNHRINNFIYLLPSSQFYQSIRGAFPTFDYVQTDANLNGIDLSIKYNFKKDWYFKSSGSIVRGNDLGSAQPLIYMPTDRIEYGLERRSSGNGKIKSHYLAISNLLVGAQYRVPEVNDFSPPPAAYSLIQLNAGMVLQLGKQVVQLDLTVSNLTNTRYREYLNRFRYYADDLGRNITLRLKIPFQLLNSKL